MFDMKTCFTLLSVSAISVCLFLKQVQYIDDIQNRFTTQNSTTYATNSTKIGHFQEYNETIKDKNNSRVSVAIMVLSSRDHFENRAVIRNTWGRGKHPVYFIIGRNYCEIPQKYRIEYSCIHKKLARNEKMDEELYGNERREVRRHEDAVSVKLGKESEQYRDIVLVSMVDSYRGLPHKLKLGWEWIVGNTDASWILKVDDDTYVNQEQLDLLIQTYPVYKTQTTIIGKIAKRWKVHRVGKWADLEYRPHHYPYFPVGAAGYLVTRDLAVYVAKHKEQLQEYQGEDVSLGIWMSEAPLAVKFVSPGGFVSDKNCFKKKNIAIGHELNAQQMRSCYNSS